MSKGLKLVRGLTMAARPARAMGVLVMLGALTLGVYAVMAQPGGSPSMQGGTGSWSNPMAPLWTPYPTSTDAVDPSEALMGTSIKRQHLFVSRIRVRNPETKRVGAYDLREEVGGVYSGEYGPGEPKYLQGGTFDIAIEAATDLRGVVPAGRYFIGEAGVGRSSDWRLSYEDMPLLTRTGYDSLCVRPWNWFHGGKRNSFLERDLGDSDYHDYVWPFGWSRGIDNAVYYPRLDPGETGLSYAAENKPYASGSHRDEIHMLAGSSVLFRDALGANLNRWMGAGPSTLCHIGDEKYLYADSPLFQSYLDSEPGRYEWEFGGIDFSWVYPHFGMTTKAASSTVPYNEEPSGNLFVPSEMMYVDSWPEMERPGQDVLQKPYLTGLLDARDATSQRSFLNDTDRGVFLSDIYGDGSVSVVGDSVNPEDVCRDFSVQLNTIEYTPEYVAGEVEAHCRGAARNYNHLSLLARDSRPTRLHEWTKSHGTPGPISCGNDYEGACLDMNVGIEGRVLQRGETKAYLYYYVYEIAWNGSTREWERTGIDPVACNDPLIPCATKGGEVRLKYDPPKPLPEKPECDYRRYGASNADLYPDDKYIGVFRAVIPPSHRVADQSEPRRRFEVEIDVDMIHKIEIGGNETGADYRLGPVSSPCSSRSADVGAGLWNPSGRAICPGGGVNCEAWMGPPAEWREFKLVHPTVTPTPTP